MKKTITQMVAEVKDLTELRGLTANLKQQEKELRCLRQENARLHKALEHYVQKAKDLEMELCDQGLPDTEGS